MAKFVIILLVALMLEAVGVVFLSGGLKQIKGAEQITVSEISRVVKSGATNHRILIGVFFEAIFFGILCYLLSHEDVSLVWPLTAVGFVITTLAAKIFLNEQVSGWRWAGIVLIVIGASFAIYDEKMREAKEKEQAQYPPQATSNSTPLRSE